MAPFWTWGVRNPAMLLGLVAIGASALGIADWSLGFASLAFFGTMAYMSNSLRGMARTRRERDINLRIAEEQARAIRERFKELHPQDRPASRKAA